jgi:cyclopropane fatty-acyl-phospholipid synthase-like methyltransferase
MTVTEKVWKEKLNNLHTREKGISSEHQIPYKELLKKVHIGKTVLDVGCGTCWLMNYLPDHVNYYGCDAHIKVGIKTLDELTQRGMLYNWKIDSDPKTDHQNYAAFNILKFQTVFMFAALDGMQDIDQAIENIKSLAVKNIVILTGINIEPDQYHTHKITEKWLMEAMCPPVYVPGFGPTPIKRIPGDWLLTHRTVVLKDKILFLEFTRK